MVFNKTPVIIQRLSPSFFGKKRVIFQKTHVFQLSIFASSFFRFFSFFMFLGVVLEETLVSSNRWALGLVTAAQPCDRQGQGGPIPCMFSLFLALLTFSICSIVFRPAYNHPWSKMASKSYRLLADGCQSAPECEQTLEGRHDETTKTSKTTKEETTKRRRPSVKIA